MASADFRAFAFDVKKVVSSAKVVGRGPYWRLYAAENLLRVIAHSILSVQIGTDWWTKAVDPTMQKETQDLASRYASRPWHTNPGAHHLYYTTLYQLAEILRVNSHILLPAIPDIDQWLVKIETIRLPRNVVGHMNFPTDTDRKRIDVLYEDVKALVDKLAADGIALIIP